MSYKRQLKYDKIKSQNIHTGGSKTTACFMDSAIRFLPTSTERILTFTG